MKKVLIITPYFPPTNAADMQRIRMSLPYFKNFGWMPEVVTVDEKYADLAKDPLLRESVPADVKIHTVGAFSKKWTSKMGLGSIALRSMFFYKKKVDQLLKKEKFDLIYISTTQFPLMILGNYWKQKFNIPYVLDFQDPWHSDYYKNKPKAERPKKYWFSYRLNKYLEPRALQNADGIISVSQGYIDTFRSRYPALINKPAVVITFGVAKRDFEIAAQNCASFENKIDKSDNTIDLLYIGRGGYDLHPALKLLFNSFKAGLAENPELFKKIRFHFIGTSYAATGLGVQTILPLAKALEIAFYVTEQTDRISFYETLCMLQNSDGLIVPGSESAAYNASKLYPYIFAKRPLLGIFQPSSSPFNIIKDGNAGDLLAIDSQSSAAYLIFNDFIKKVQEKIVPQTNWSYFEQYTAENLTKEQTRLFDEVLSQSAQTIQQQ